MASVATCIYFSYYESYIFLFLSPQLHLIHELTIAFSFPKLDTFYGLPDNYQNVKTKTREKEIFISETN